MAKKLFKPSEAKVEKKVEKVEVKKAEPVSKVKAAIEEELSESWLIKHRDRLIKKLGL